jgi:hypothetical protein
MFPVSVSHHIGVADINTVAEFDAQAQYVHF